LSGAIIFDYARKIDYAKSFMPFLLAVTVRLILLPILFLMVAKWMTPNVSLKEVLLLQAAMPAATFPIVMARLYNQSIETALTVVVGTSLLGLITIPIWMVIGANWLGL
jgi:malate permease and related proteins